MQMNIQSHTLEELFIYMLAEKKKIIIVQLHSNKS